MKVKFLKFKSWLLATAMGALGFSSCHCHKQLSEPEPEPEPKVRDRGEMQLMYGVPTMNYMIRGQVRDSEGQPVGNIHINMLERNMEVRDGELQGDPESVSMWLEKTAIVTDKEGRFMLHRSGLPQEQVRLMVRDVDGRDNGDFKDSVVEMDVTPDNVDRTNAGGWNQGTFNKEVEIKLENK